MRDDVGDAVLEVDALVTGYGDRKVVDDVSFVVPAYRVVALIGHNGAGKSTILRAVFGLLRVWSGDVRVEGISGAEWLGPRSVREQIAYVPQGRNVFAEMTVRENLLIGLAAVRDRTNLEERLAYVTELFPVLASRMKAKAQQLSGGQMQMLAVGRALMSTPRLLLLDEPSAGLAPRAVTELFETLRKATDDQGLAVLVVEQRVREVLKFADDCGVLRRGQLSYWGDASSLSDEALLRKVFL